jgi:Tol biopolymer transport system component
MKATFAAVAVLATAIMLITPGTARPAFPGTNGRIAFATDRDGNFEIYTMNADGSGQTRLTTATGDDLYPVWSADGAKLAFSSQRTGFNSQIYTMTAGGANQTPLTSTSPASNYEPAWSPTGTQLGFVSDRNDGIQLWKMNADGSGQVQLTDALNSYNVDPVWSPDGAHIAFTSSRDGNEEIYVVNADGTNPTRLTNDPGSDAGPAYSPDGTKIAFQTTRGDGSRDVWVMNADGTSQVPLASGPAFDSSPAWSPDGSKILFQSDRDGDFEIFTMNPDGSNQTPLTSNTALDRLADWQPIGSGGGADTTAPVLTLPANMTVDATSPAGAVVNYTATATDNVDPNPAVTCAPASGATFAIGTTTVNCSATDSSTNSSHGSFTVTVRSAQAQLQNLVQSVLAATNLPPALKNRLLNAAANFNPNNPFQRQVACNTLAAFISGAQRLAAFGLISAAQAASWIADARQIRAVLGC